MMKLDSKFRVYDTEYYVHTSMVWRFKVRPPQALVYWVLYDK